MTKISFHFFFYFINVTPLALNTKFYLSLSKLSFCSLWFGHFCHFSPNLKVFKSGALLFQFCCHFDPNLKSD
ncbi:hypothetical protein Hanom_Chr17g01588061 [Helianthus anomalus]